MLFFADSVTVFGRGRDRLLLFTLVVQGRFPVQRAQPAAVLPRARGRTHDKLLGQSPQGSLNNSCACAVGQFDNGRQSGAVCSTSQANLTTPLLVQWEQQDVADSWRSMHHNLIHWWSRERDEWRCEAVQKKALPPEGAFHDGASRKSQSVVHLQRCVHHC